MNEENFINFIHQTRRIYGLLCGIIDKELADLKINDITASHYVVLSIIAREKKILFKDALDFTKKLGVKSNGHLVYTVSTDYILKTTYEKNKGSYFIELSDKGKAVVNEIYIRTMNSLNAWIDDQYEGDDFTYKRIEFGKMFESYMDNGLMLETALNDVLVNNNRIGVLSDD